MKSKLIAVTLLIFAFSSQSAIVLNDGESYSASFELNNTPNTSKFTDFWWEAIVEIVDSAATPNDPNGNPGNVTLTVFENMDLTSPLYTESMPSNLWLADYGILFGSYDLLAMDKNGSFTITYNGFGTANLISVHMLNFAGDLPPTNVASKLIFPQASNTPPPSSVDSPSVFLLTGLLAFLFTVSRKRVNPKLSALTH